MSRQLRVQFPGALFHVTSRGNEKRDIFLDDKDRRLFLSLLATAIERFKWIVTAYVLMSNHFHLLLELTVESLSPGMRWLNSTYAQGFNKRHDRVEKDGYWMTLLRYVILNPVRAGMVAKPVEYEWSSYRATAGLVEPPEWLAVDRVLDTFGAPREFAEARYQRFIADTPENPCPWKDLIAGTYLGSESWVEAVRARIERPGNAEHPLIQRRPRVWAIDDVLATVAGALNVDVLSIRNGRGGTERMIAAWLGANECLLPLSSIASGLGFGSVSHASRLAKRCDIQLERDEDLRLVVDRCRDLLYRT
jgi:putative transposase